MFQNPRKIFNPLFAQIRPLRGGGGGGRGVPESFLVESWYFCELGALSKFQNTMINHSGRKVTTGEEEEEDEKKTLLIVVDKPSEQRRSDQNK